MPQNPSVNAPVGNWLIIAGVALVVVGFVVKTGSLGWFGNLPGDIEIKREGFRFFFPLASMIVISVVASLLFSFIRRFF